MNKVMIIGYLATTPDRKKVKEAWCTDFILVCYTRRKDARGERIQNSYRVTTWKTTGEMCSKSLHKGDKVCVHGDLLLQEYVDTQGRNSAALQVMASEVELLMHSPKHS